MKAGTQRSLGRLVGIMLIIVVAGVIVARSYYGNMNRSVDPRIQHARELYELYDQYARTGDYYRIFALLDTISEIYMSIPHYEKSFELGVLHNNRAAAMLTIALYRDSIPDSSNPLHVLSADSIVNMAAHEVETAISQYKAWSERFEGKEEEEIRIMIRQEFLDGLETTSPEMSEKYLNTRVKELENATVENVKRLSVCHTNLGLVYRYWGDYKEAVAEYELAMTLWDQNLDAENNLNKLLNRPIKKRNFIQKMFPPKKE